MARVKEDNNEARNVCKEISQAQSKRRKSRKVSTRSAVLSLVKRWPSAKQGAQVEKGENEARNVCKEISQMQSKRQKARKASTRSAVYTDVHEQHARNLTNKKHGKYDVLVCAH